jgi:hypothetical protein
VVDHDGEPFDASRSFEGPFDAIQREVGLDRYFDLRVARGQESARAREYRFDPRIEYADLTGNCPVVGLSLHT